MDSVAVHRCRFVDWLPNAIDVLEFNRRSSYVAAVRSNGDVEVWSVESGWHLECIVKGSSEALIWTRTHGQGQSPGGEKAKGKFYEEERLLGCTLQGAIVEIDFHTLSVTTLSDTYGGAAWCMGMPSSTSESGNTLAVGCEDGFIRLFEVGQEDCVYRRSFVGTGGSRVVSLAFHGDGETLFSGHADGNLRCWDVRSGTSSFRMTMESYGSQTPITWSLKVLQDMTVVSGDSTGRVQFWDGNVGTQLKSFAIHSADVLALAVDSSESRVFASGVDSRVIMIERTGGGDWVYSYSHRPHTHDVRALAIMKQVPEPSSACQNLPGAVAEEILVSGGVDTQLCWYSVSQFKTRRPFKIPPFPQRSSVSVSQSQRAMLVSKDSSMELWQLARPKENQAKDIRHAFDDAENIHQLLIELRVGVTAGADGQEKRMNIVCSALSEDCRWVACSNGLGLRLFRLDPDRAFKVSKCRLPEGAREPALCLAFSPDSRRLIAASSSGVIRVIDVHSLRVLQVFGQHVTRNRIGEEPEDDGEEVLVQRPSPVSTLAVSRDGQWLASGDLENNIFLFNLDGLKFYGQLPFLPALHTTFAFHPSSLSLVVSTVDNRFYLFDVESRTLTDWSRENSENLPPQLTKRTGKIKGITFNPARPSCLVLYSHSYFAAIDLDKPFDQVAVPEEVSEVLESAKKKPKLSATAEESTSQGGDKGEKAQGKPSARNLHIVEKYRPIFHLDFLHRNEIVVIEMPWLKVISSLPETLYRHRYGT